MLTRSKFKCCLLTVLLGLTVAIGGVGVSRAATEDEGPTVDERLSESPVAPLYSNSDLQQLPPSDNTPSAEPSDNRSAGATAAGSSDALQSLERWRKRLVRERDLAEAQRRVREARENVARLEGGFRPKGSAFPDGAVTADQMFVRSVTDPGTPYEAARRQAYAELAEARSELKRVLADQGTSPA